MKLQTLAAHHGLKLRLWGNGRVSITDGNVMVVYFPESNNRTAMVMGGETYQDCTPENVIDICLNRIMEVQIRWENGEYRMKPKVKMNEVRR